ncbi:aminopeptidase N-like isoform X2 [Venturia canescens]|uniref:aminopeptidase N-like isoform X2 n=1 Tax=Venturia canescens TaxID=32260 RepID=UPI001C9CAF88|nr:aminopeptidase N-like isoform X2 [Venturia canescens]
MSLQRYVSSCILLIVSTSAIPLVKDTIIGSLNKRFRREDGSSMAYRLSEAVIPTKYTIRLELDMASGNFKFNGETDIEIQVRQQTSTIILHAKKLIFESKYTKLLRADGSRVKVESSWRMMEQFVTEELQKEAFVADDKESQHAMDFTANKVLEPRKVFDEITYDKSACVIRMFSHVLTPTVFQSGLQNYLMHKSYDTVTSADLIRELVTVAGKDIEFLDKALLSWITRPGYPVVTVMRNHSAGTAAISQKRFLTNPLAVRTGKWFVPINVVSEEEPNRFSDTKPTHWLLDDAQSLRLSGLKNDKWIILNSQQTGYYRVNYDAENWKLIIDYLQNPNSMKNIHVLNRAQLLDDSFHLAAAVELPNYSVFFNMTKYLQHEEDLIPWCAAHRALAFLNKVLANSKCYDLFKLYVQRLTANLEEKLGYTENANEDYDAKMSRLNLVRLACAVGSAKCLAATHKMLLEHVGGIKKISVDLQSVVLCAGMRSASRQQWEMVYNYTTKLPEDTDEHSISFAALGCHSDPVVLEMYLEKALITASDSIRNYVAKALYNGDMPGVDIDVFFDFMEDHLETIYKRSFLENGTNLIFIHSIEIASRMTTREQIKRLQHLIAELRRHYHLLAVYVHDHAEAKADGNVRWVENHETDVTTFLAAQHLITE